MLQSYVAAGFDPAGFWSLSPRLYLSHMRGAGGRLQREHRDRAWLAWHVEALHRQDKLPDAEKFITGKSRYASEAIPGSLAGYGDGNGGCMGRKGAINGGCSDRRFARKLRAR